MRNIICLTVGIATFQVASQAAAPLELKDQKAKASYAIGRSIAENWKNQQFDVDVDLVATGIKDGFANKTNILSQEESSKILETFQRESRQKVTDARKRQGEENKKAGDAFREEFRKKPGTKVTQSGLLYRVITEGKGEIPKATDTVNAHYAGRFINGQEFDSSYKRNQAYTTAVSGGVIKGWTEALQLMPVGSKWEIVIHPELGYGENGRGSIGPNSTLVFELELIGIQPRSTPEPVTSDIIKVPSAEELKKGAQIEVIKKEDVERLQREAQQQKK